MAFIRLRLFAGAVLLMAAANPALADRGDDDGTVVPRLKRTPSIEVSTIPPNGDLNPYGVAFVPREFPRDGELRPGDVLVSNFNNADNLQGTGTTIVRVDRQGNQSLFFEDANAPGLSTALSVLKSGYVLVGNVPSANGSGVCNTLQSDVGPGALLVIDRHGALVQTFTSQTFFNGPWDMTVKDEGDLVQIFISNVLSGTVSRLDVQLVDEATQATNFQAPLFVTSATTIASGYTHVCDPAAFVLGPTGVALDERLGSLYVASTADNLIFAVPDASSRLDDAGTGRVVVDDQTHLHGPLGLVLAPNGDLVSAQGDAVNPDPARPSEIVEFTPRGEFVAEISINPQQGAAFGVAIAARPHGFRFAAVDDVDNAVHLWNVK